MAAAGGLWTRSGLPAPTALAPSLRRLGLGWTAFSTSSSGRVTMRRSGRGANTHPRPREYRGVKPGGGGGLAEAPTLKIRGAKRGLWGGVRMR